MSIYRGPGGGGDATVDTELNSFISLKDQALQAANNAEDSATAAALSETNAAASALAASNSATDASTLYDSFDDRYLGAKAVAPTLDNDGNALIEGALYWNSVYKLMYAWNGSSWAVMSGATGGADDQVFYENKQVVTTNYAIATGKNAMSAGPITINSGITVTVPSGSTWTIV